jgi:sortase A
MAGAVMMALAVALSLVVVAVTLVLRDEPEKLVATPAKAASLPEPLVRGEPLGDAWVEESLPQPEPPKEQPPPEPEPQPAVASRPEPKREPEPEPPPQPEPKPEPKRESLPAEEAAWPAPTDEQLRAASGPRHYDLPPRAIMGLTMKALNVYNAPVFDSDAPWALDSGVAHVPETSLPWSRSPQRNVYLEGHRLGWPGTGSHLVFYYLNRLQSGDEIILKDRDGKKYSYRVSEKLVVNPDDVWVMGQIRGRDMLTLQTCTPIPTFEKRLIVRANRV